MENFTVRISRRDAKHPERVTGQVEDAGKGEQKPFKNIEELMEILGTKKTGDVRFCVE